MMMKRIALTTLAAAATFTTAALAPAAVTPAAAQSLGIYIGTPPPVRYQYVPPVPAGYVWAPGYWRWDRGRQVWIDGRWMKPRHGHRWAPGHWNRGWGWGHD
jgi:hypothetical protein